MILWVKFRLKHRGYNLGHHLGHGKEYASELVLCLIHYA
jgi:hypothetical protein